MPNISQVNLTAGVPTGPAGAATVSTIDNLPNLVLQNKITDAVNTATVKAASTAPVSGDSALVVAIHPLSVNANGQTTMSASAPVTIASDQSSIPVTTTQSATANGLTLSSTLIASGTNATSVKASAGKLYKVEAFNNSGNIAYLKLYNTAGTPTAGSGTPVWRMLVPSSTSGTGVVSQFETGLTFGTGIGFTFTGGIADADTTSVAASAFIVNLGYK